MSTTTRDTITIPEAADDRPRRRMFGRPRPPDRGHRLPVERPVVPPAGPVISLR